MNERCVALIGLGRILQQRAYQFVAVTPATHDRVLRREAKSTSLESIFGWSRPFEPDEIENCLMELLEQAEAIEVASGECKSKVRFATVGDSLFVHSAFPTTEADSVFLGPDTYRFVRFLRTALADLTIARSSPAYRYRGWQRRRWHSCGEIDCSKHRSRARRHKSQCARLQRGQRNA